jgi:hypothetical protein
MTGIPVRRGQETVFDLARSGEALVYTNGIDNRTCGASSWSQVATLIQSQCQPSWVHACLKPDGI